MTLGKTLARWAALILLGLTLGEGLVLAQQTGGGGAGTSLPPSGAAGGDLTGTYPNPTIAKIQTVTVSGVTGTGNAVLSASPTLTGRVILPGQINGTRVVVAAGAVTVATTDYVVVVNKTVGAATVANLPATPTTGQTFRIKDGKGDANANNITVTPAAGTIDGAATYIINTNYGAVDLTYNGTEWNVL